MKNANLIAMSFLSIALVAGMSGCKHRPPNTIAIPENGGPPSGANPALGPGAGDTTAGSSGTTSSSLDNGPVYTGLFNGPHTEDRAIFQADTIYFDFDSSTIKPGEEPKLQAVANY